MNRKDTTYLIIKLKFNHPTQHDINCIGKNLTQNNVFVIYWENFPKRKSNILGELSIELEKMKYQSSYLGIL